MGEGGGHHNTQGRVAVVWTRVLTMEAQGSGLTLDPSEGRAMELTGD